jgi:hypothetical protein
MVTTFWDILAVFCLSVPALYLVIVVIADLSAMRKEAKRKRKHIS